MLILIKKFIDIEKKHLRWSWFFSSRYLNKVKEFVELLRLNISPFIQFFKNENNILQVSHVQPGIFWVQDTSNKESEPEGHTVSFGDATSFPSCNCDDWQHFKLPCKHLCSVFQSFPDWGWDMLNGTYTANPLINLDFSCIQTLIQDKGKQVAKLSHFNPNANVTQIQANVTILSTTTNSSQNVNTTEPSSSISNPSEISNSSKEKVGALETSVQTSAETSAAIESIKNNSDSSHKTEKCSLFENQRKTLLGNMETVSRDPGNSEQVESLLSNLKEFLKAVPKDENSLKTTPVNLINGHDSVESTEALVEGSPNKKPRLDKPTPGNHLINSAVKEVETEITVSTIPEGESTEECIVGENESPVALSNKVNSSSKEENKGSDGLLQQDNPISIINLESAEEIPSEESLVVV